MSERAQKRPLGLSEPPNRAERRHPGSSDLWTLDQAAQYLGLSRHGAANLANGGKLPGAVKLGRRWRVSVPTLMRALHGETAEGAA